MRHLILAATISLAALCVGGEAKASADGNCNGTWRLDNREKGCADTAIIAPGNDTRSNLLLLLSDRRPSNAPTKYETDDWDAFYGRNFFNWRILRGSFYPSGAKASDAPAYAGSRCISYNGGTTAFEAALAVSKSISAVDRKLLSEKRQKLANLCEGGEEALPAYDDSVVSGAPAKEFFRYLDAAAAFYGEDFSRARSSFTTLAKSNNAWLKEAASYMIARTELNAAQVKSFNEYGGFDGPKSSDKTALNASEAGFQAYLKSYPKGRYADSAKGLMRRVYWLSGDSGRLAGLFSQAISGNAAASSKVADLVEEADLKLLFEKNASQVVKDPLLLAAIDLALMRRDRKPEGPAITRADLEKQKPFFAQSPGLHDFLLATHAFYIAGDAKQVLTLIPDATRQKDYGYLEFSRQALRGLALQKLKDRNEGGFWRDMLGGAKRLYQRPTVELGLAMQMERAGQVDQIFAAGSPITEPYIRLILLQHSAGPALLQQTATNKQSSQHERDLALFTLLYKQLTRGDYTGFLTTQKLIPAGAKADENYWNFLEPGSVPVGVFGPAAKKGEYACPSLAKSVQSLSNDPKNARGKLCLGDFVRLNGFDQFWSLDEAPGKEELGGSKSMFAGKPMSRKSFYVDIIADPKAGADEKAYALYRAVNCYAPAKYNTCGGKDVEPAQRKTWFTQLKRDYPNSQWSKNLRYYW